MTPTEELFMEVLAARYRLGEKFWTFPRRGPIVTAAKRLQAQGLIYRLDGVVERTFRAGLTEAGKAAILDPRYRPPRPVEVASGLRWVDGHWRES